MEHMPRRSKPHIAVITFRIDIRPLNANNTFSDYILQNKDLEKYSLGEKAQIVVRGTCEADCASKVKKMMEKLNEE
jgi:GTPase involved in cell partitioning and DNA repair